MYNRIVQLDSYVRYFVNNVIEQSLIKHNTGFSVLVFIRLK